MITLEPGRMRESSPGDRDTMGLCSLLLMKQGCVVERRENSQPLRSHQGLCFCVGPASPGGARSEGSQIHTTRLAGEFLDLLCELPSLRF